MNAQKITSRQTLFGALRAHFRTVAILTATGLALAFGPGVHAGATFGPPDFEGTVSAHATNTWQIAFNGGESAALEVYGLDPGDIDVYVYDEDMDLVAYNSLPDSDPVCLWDPTGTEQYTIEVINRTGHAITYRLTTN